MVFAASAIICATIFFIFHDFTSICGIRLIKKSLSFRESSWSAVTFIIAAIERIVQKWYYHESFPE